MQSEEPDRQDGQADMGRHQGRDREDSDHRLAAHCTPSEEFEAGRLRKLDVFPDPRLRHLYRCEGQVMAVGGEPVAFFHNGHAPRLHNQEEPDCGRRTPAESVVEAEEQVRAAEAARVAEARARGQDQAQLGGEGGAEREEAQGQGQVRAGQSRRL